MIRAGFFNTEFAVNATMGSDTLPPITLVALSGPNRFQEYLTAKEARDLAGALLGAAETCESEETS